VTVDYRGRDNTSSAEQKQAPSRSTAGPLNIDDQVDSDQQVVNKELSLSRSYRGRDNAPSGEQKQAPEPTSYTQHPSGVSVFQDFCCVFGLLGLGCRMQGI
jgi:hypothetical protein